jgi:hypothetical protein
MHTDFPPPREPTNRPSDKEGSSDVSAASMTGCIQRIAFLLRKNTPKADSTKPISWSAEKPLSMSNRIEAIARILKSQSEK